MTMAWSKICALLLHPDAQNFSPFAHQEIYLDSPEITTGGNVRCTTPKIVFCHMISMTHVHLPQRQTILALNFLSRTNHFTRIQIKPPFCQGTGTGTKALKNPKKVSRN